ncbi:MAG: anti-sigma factor [Flavobacterium sp.]|uniref:anti-sigma factor n=1 Tax=Flavobacterium sp. TaxID=239 RepID=UPI001227908C|nr:anti-sigma factor [Flavobacterium sp.]RZJ66616.1 MAG: anti-sigma factor [Flavobacterium sp.]
MKTENDSIESLFTQLEGQWDIYEPSRGHSERFLDKQSRKTQKVRWFPMSIAASILLAVGWFTFINNNNPGRQQQIAEMSSQTRETDSVFTAIIKYEMQRIKQKNSPINQQIIKDALAQLEEMDADYEKIKTDLAKGGESQQLIHALVSNLKTQISFLENILDKIEQNEQLNDTTNEKVM